MNERTQHEGIREWVEVDGNTDADRIRLGIHDTQTGAEDGNTEAYFITLSPEVAYKVGAELLQKAVAAKGLDWHLHAILWSSATPGGEEETVETTPETSTPDPENLPS